MKKNKTLSVIGSGVGGLAIAIRAAVKGYNVQVFEQQTKPGGKISEISADGFRFDTGPSVFTLPEMVRELYQLAGRDPDKGLPIKKLGESCRYFYDDGTIVNAHDDIQTFAKEMQAKTGEKPANILNFLKKSKILYELTAPVFIFRPFYRIKNLMNLPSFKTLLNIGKLNAFKTMHQENAEQFKSNKVVKLFDRYATYNGSDPYQAPATLNVIPHLEHNLGTFLPVKGMHAIVQGLMKLGQDQGVKYFFDTTVKSVDIQKNRVKGLSTSNGYHPTDVCVSDLDVASFYKNILKDEKALQKNLESERSSSALIFYWGIDGEYDNLSIHNILFANQYKEEFKALFKDKTIYHDPTVYIYISSKIITGDAPKDKENWFVMINAPEHNGQDWKALASEARENIIKKINKVLKTDIEQKIIFEQHLDPSGIEKKTASFHGSLYGSSSNDKFAAFKRHPNINKKYKNLYFVGGSVHPGGGIPLCLASAKIVADHFLKTQR